MLSDEVLDVLGERLSNRINIVNEEIIVHLAKTISLFNNLNTSEAHQLAQILKFGGDYKKIRKRIAQLTKMNLKDIDKIFDEVAENNQEFAKQFYEYRKKQFIPFDENEALQRQVDAIKKITMEKMVNISNTTGLGYLIKDKDKNIVFRNLKYIYDEVIDRAVLSVSQGKTTFDKALFDLMKDIGQSGLRYIEFESGYARRLDSSARMNLMSGLRDMSNNIQQEFGKEFDADGVEISVHTHPAPDHAKVQGRQFRNKEFDNFQNDKDAVSVDGMEFPHIAEETKHDRRSIGQYNCYHYIFSIIVGVSKPLYSKKQLQKILEDNAKGFKLDGKEYTLYQGTQMQRQLETRIREQKDLQIIGKNMNNEEGNKLVADSQKKINQLTKKYKELSQISKLPVKKDRLRVSGYTTYGRKREPKEKKE